MVSPLERSGFLTFGHPSEVVPLSPAERLGIPVARLGRAALLKVGPRVRIRLPPAVSQTNSEVRNRHQYFPSAFTQASAGEFSAIAGVTDERHQVKELFRHPRIIPRTVVLDPAVTVHTPEWLWLSTGVRAVDHCVEGICSGDANPYADAQALHGLALLYRGLPRIKADPSDLAARLDCQIGSSLSMAARQRCTDGSEPSYRLCAGCGFRRPARPYLMHHAAGSNALEQAGKRRAASSRLGGDGASGRRCRRGARYLYRRARHAAQPWRRQGRSRELRAARRAAMDTPWVPRNPRLIAGPAQVREILELAA
jgi:maleylacetate reductase